MTTLNYDELERETFKLHFARVLSELEQYPEAESEFKFMLLKAKVQRGTYAYENALRSARLALTLAEKPSERYEAMLEEARCLFCLNQPEEALGILTPLCDDETQNDSFYPQQKEAGMQMALICSEIGRVDRALELLEEFHSEEDLSHAPEKQIRRAIDTLTLQGDLLSYKSSMPGADTSSWTTLAFDSYHQALELTILLEDTPFCRLRQALIFNNRADLYEQKEDWENAGKDYESAFNLISAIDDPQIFDLEGYQADILMSLGNFFALQDDEVTARQLLEKARVKVENIHNRQQKSYYAKLCYLEGLSLLYDGSPQAADRLEESYQTYKSLLATGMDKEERLANAAFYLAASMPDDPRNFLRKTELYEEALPILKRVWPRNPELYLSNLAALYNDMGSMAYYQQKPDAAMNWYLQALELYEEINTLDPSDSFTRLNMVVARFNIISAAQGIVDDMIAQKQLTLALAELRSLSGEAPEYQQDIYYLLDAFAQTPVAVDPKLKEEFDSLLNELRPANLSA